MNTDFTQVFELTLSEKLQLLENLWDSIASDPDQIPVLDWQKEELARRTAHSQNPGSGSSWEAAKERIRSGQYGSSHLCCCQSREAKQNSTDTMINFAV